MVEKGTEVRVCSTIYRYVKASNKYMKDYDNNKESSYLSIRMWVIYMDGKSYKFFL